MWPKGVGPHERMAINPRNVFPSAQGQYEEGGPAGGSVLPLAQLLAEKADPGSLMLLMPKMHDAIKSIWRHK